MKQSLDTRTKLLTQRPFSLMLELSIPAVLGMVVVGLYNMMDSIFVGQMVGSVQMGAVSVSYPFTLINAGSAAMLGVGSASVLSRAIGKKDEDTVKKIMGNLVAAVVILSVIYTVIGMVFTRQLLSLAGASDNILNYAEKYLRIVFAGSLFVNFFQSANMVIRGEGQLKKAMFIIASGAILNIILDPFFITLLNPYGMGIEGAAYATVLSQFVQAVITVRYFKKKSPNVKIGRIRIDGPKIELVVLLTAFYGLRRSEVIGLKWSAFDFNHNCFSIRHTVTTCNVKGERVTIKKDKAKNKSSLRTYPLIPFLKERLLEAKKQQEENRKLCGRSYNKEYLGYVCVDVIGNLIKPNYVSSTFGKLLAKNNLRHIRFHDLRHTCASLLLANGVPMEQVKEWLGHSEISTTVDIYGHLQYATKKQSAAAIEQDIVAPMLQNLSAVSP